MKTWKTRRSVCRSRKSGRFVRRKKCGQFKRQRVRVCCIKGLLFS